MNKVIRHIKPFIRKIFIISFTIIKWPPFLIRTERPRSQKVNSGTTHIVNLTICNMNVINLGRCRKISVSVAVGDNIHSNTAGSLANIRSRTMETVNNDIVNINMFQCSDIFCLDCNTAAVNIISVVPDIESWTFSQICLRPWVHNLQIAHFPILHIIKLENIIYLCIVYLCIGAHNIWHTPIRPWLEYRSVLSVSITSDRNRHTFASGTLRFKTACKCLSLFKENFIARQKSDRI